MTEAGGGGSAAPGRTRNRALVTTTRPVPPLSPSRAWPWTFTVPLLAAVALVALGGMVAQTYWLTLLTQAAIFAVAVLGLNILIGYSGQVSFAHAVFFGIGAYVTAMGTTEWGLSPLLAAGLGVATSVAVSVVVGIPVLRLHGYYLAMATFALGVAFYAFLGSAPWFHGFSGIPGVPPFSVGPMEVSSLAGKYWFAWGVALVAVVAAWRLRAFRFGRALLTIAEDEQVAESVGIRPLPYKVAAFAISSIFASVAGSVFAHTSSYVSPESFSFLVAINLFVMLFVGGLRGVWGVIVGAIAITILPEVFGDLQPYRPALISVLLIGILIVRPAGLLAPLPEMPALDLRSMLRNRRMGHAA